MDKDFAIRMGNAIRQARLALQLTQQEVADRLEVSVDFYSRIERGHANPSIDTLLRMMAVLSASADTLLALDDLQAAEPTAFPLMTADDPPEVRRLIAALAEARPSTIRLVNATLNEIERAEAIRKRARRAREFAPSAAGERRRRDSPAPSAAGEKRRRDSPAPSAAGEKRRRDSPAPSAASGKRSGVSARAGRSRGRRHGTA